MSAMRKATRQARREDGRIVFKRCVLILLIAFFLNLLWEAAHYVLYLCKIPLGVCALTTASRDAFIVLGMYGIGVILFRDWQWTAQWQRKHTFFIAWVSFLVAWFIEVQGLMLQKWQYAPTMPILPVLNVGLSPIAQMVILVPLTFFFVQKALK